MALLKLGQNDSSLDRERVKKALDYIEGYWAQLIREQKSDTGTLIGLPHPYVVPAADEKAVFQFEEQYYWDSYFTALGLKDPQHQPLVEGMLDNLIHLFERFHIIPNGSRMYFTSRSHPPLLTSFIFHVYDTYGKSTNWLRPRIAVAKAEYEQVWMSEAHPEWHQVYRGLSRYYDINALHDLAEAASGWDMTTRFERKCLDYLPIDLNCLLYKYEVDFARAAELLGHHHEAGDWRLKAAARQHTINRLMWGKLRGFYFDYNYEKEELGGVWSLAGYYALWAGVASPTQAAKMVENLEKFKKSGGLTTTTRPLIDMSIFGSLKAQWAYPNGWAPLHYLVTEGLKRYGYERQAREIARRWLRANLYWFEKHGVFLEKYNVVNPKKPPVEGLYPSQTGFGWTNAVFRCFADEYLD